jgi:hypothetical protein
VSALVLFYSLSGHTAKRAADFANAAGADLVEVRPAAKAGKFKAYTVGILNAIKGRPMPIKPIDVDFSKYSDVFAFAPVWADGISPFMIAALQQVAKGTKISLRLVSMSGNSNKAKNTAVVEAMGLTVAGYEDIKVTKKQ